MIRLAKPSDAAELLKIYKPHVIDSTVSFETVLPSIAQFEKRIETYMQKYPWLVFLHNNQIAGYAYASTYREREAYQWSIECSVYVASNFKKLGIAASLYDKLFKILQFQGFKTVYAVITLPNVASVSLHEKIGFTHFATYKNVGYKCNQWCDVGWWSYTINNFTAQENPPQYLAQLPLLAIENFLK